MNIVHSFWSKPSFHKDQSYCNSRELGGWPSERLLWLSIAFSCYAAKAHCATLSLVTDSEGYDTIIDRMQLPYDDVVTHLDRLDDKNHKLWVLGKLSAFQLQRKPFLHIDNDVYLWGHVDFPQNPGELIAQSRILIPQDYRNTLQRVFKYFSYIPEVICKRGIPDNMHVINAGIIGGNNLDFFQRYCDLAEQFVRLNEADLSKVDIGSFNTILDEYLFTCLAEEEGCKVNFHIDVPIEDSFKAIVRFNLVPFIDKYIHLVGIAKRNKYACQQMEYRFRYEFPREYKKICRWVDDICPPSLEDNNQIEEEKWKKLRKAFKMIYNNNLESLLDKKVTLPDSVKISRRINEQGEDEYDIEIYRGNNTSEYGRLNGLDEALIHFQSPVSINELLNRLKDEGCIFDSISLQEYRFKLIDFVTEKITMDGVLEFA